MRLVLLGVLLSWAAPAEAIPIERLASVRAGGPPVEVVAEQAMVRFSSQTATAQRASALSAGGAVQARHWPSIGWTLVNLPAGMGVLSGLDLLRGLPGVVAVEPNFAFRPSRTPNDPFVNTQYGLSQINAFAAWEFEVGTSNVTTIAVVDAGVLSTHPDLAAKMAGLDHRFCDPTAPAANCASEVPQVACNHGTRVAGVAAASTDNGEGVAGVSWGAQVLALRVFRTADCLDDCSDESIGGCATDDAGIIEALDYARSLQDDPLYGKIVVNISLGGGGACPGPVKAAIDLAVAAGIPVAVAAGNSGGAVESPANCATTTGGSGIIPVGATDAANNVTGFSCKGPELSANGVVAPGDDVRTTDLSGTAEATGTSFSAPHVAGLAALIMSAKPAFTPAQVQSTIRAGADSIGVSTLGRDAGGRPAGNTSGAGRVNAFRSMRLAVRGTLGDFEGERKPIAFPNPFRISANPTVTFAIPSGLQGGGATIRVYTVSGDLVRELTGLTWDGKNAAGRPVATGTYLFSVSTDRGHSNGRLAVIR